MSSPTFGNHRAFRFVCTPTWWTPPELFGAGLSTGVPLMVLRQPAGTEWVWLLCRRTQKASAWAVHSESINFGRDSLLPKLSVAQRKIRRSGDATPTSGY